MESPLEDVDWLTRSSHRVSILDALSDAPRDRSELQSITGANRVTVGRVLSDLEERTWVERNGHDYHLTPLGELIVEDLSTLFETTAATRKLDDVVPHLPVESFDFDLRRLADAEIVEGTPTNTTRPLKRSTEILTAADEVKVVSAQWDALHMQTAVEFLEENPDAYHAHLVLCGDAVAEIREDEDMVQWFRETYELTTSDYYRHPDTPPCSTGIYDETVVLKPVDDRGYVPAVIVSQDEAVWEWAVGMFEEFREGAESITPAALEPA